MQSIFATGMGLSSSSCGLASDASMCSDTDASVSASTTPSLIERIATLTKKAANTGISLGQLCSPIDELLSGTSNPIDCCANADNNQMHCIQRTFASGHVSSPGTPGMCLSTDSLCGGATISKDEIGTLEVLAGNAAISLGSTCQTIEMLATGNLQCCANSQNGQMGCIATMFAGGLIDDNGIGVCTSTDKFCNQGT